MLDSIRTGSLERADARPSRQAAQAQVASATNIPMPTDQAPKGLSRSGTASTVSFAKKNTGQVAAWSVGLAVAGIVVGGCIGARIGAAGSSYGWGKGLAKLIAGAGGAAIGGIGGAITGGIIGSRR